MNDQGEQLAVRKMAVEHHHAEAKRFVDWYEEMAKSRFANAFSYRRYKIDVLLDEVLKQQQLGDDYQCFSPGPQRNSFASGQVESSTEHSEVTSSVSSLRPSILGAG